MTIPSKTTLDSLALHCLVSRNSIFDKPGEQVPVVRQTIGKRWSIIKDIFICAIGASISLIDRGLEGAISSPELERLIFESRKVWLRINLWICHGASL